MANKRFTPEEREALRQNPYVLKVTDKSVQFNVEFKQIVMRESRSGKSRGEILGELGIDIKILGNTRLDSLFARLRIQSKRPSGFERIPMMGRAKKVRFSSLEEENQYLRDRNEYLKQENEFLKKLKALERGE